MSDSQDDDEITYVYILAREMDGYPVHPVKVGIAKNPSSRLRAIQTATPFKIDIFWVFRLWDRHIAKGVEGGFHQVLKERKSHGEWFDMHPHYALELMKQNLLGLYNSWPGMKDLPPIPLDEFLWVCNCPESWIQEARETTGITTPLGSAVQ